MFSRKSTGSGSAMAEASRPFASGGVAGTTTFRPGVCKNTPSRLSEWSSGVRTPPPYGARTTIGQVNALPMMADSESGVSQTRFSPNFFCRCSVTRKTPPLAPISCPSTTTRSSRSNSSASALFRASIIVICIDLSPPLSVSIHKTQQVFALLLQAWRKLSKHPVKKAIGSWWIHCFGYTHGLVDLFLYFFDNASTLFLVQQATFHQETLEAHDRVLCPPGFYLRRVAIACGIIGGGMRSDAIR